MPRYVDADKIFYRERMTVFYNSKPIKEDVAFKQDIEKVQTEDVAPITHAHWINVGQVRNECSNCHNVHVGIFSKTLYCPNCGAVMDAVMAKGLQDD